MAEGATAPAPSTPTARAQARLEHAGGYNWRERALGVVRGLGFKDADLDRPLRHVLGRRADARIAGPRAGRRPRPAAARRADQPPGHRVARVAREPPADDRRRGRPRGPRPLVPRGRRHGRARARGRPRPVLQGHVARLAQGEGGARARARPRDRAPAGGDRAARAVRRPASAPARARARRSRARRSWRRWSGSSATRSDGQGPVVRVHRPGPHRPRRARAGERHDRGARPHAARGRRALARARRARLARRPERHGQDHADRDARGRASRCRRASCKRGHNVEVGYLSQHAEELGSRGHRARGLPARDRADAEQGARAARPVPVLRRGGREAARGPLRRRAAAAVAGDPRQLGRERPDPRRADEPPGPRIREALEDALRAFPGTLLLVSHDRALLDAVGARTVAIEDGKLRSYEGGWADYVRVRDEKRAAEEAAKRAKGEEGRREGEAGRRAAAKTNGAGPSKNQQKRIAAARARDREGGGRAVGRSRTSWPTRRPGPPPRASALDASATRQAKKAVEELYAQLESAGA